MTEEKNTVTPSNAKVEYQKNLDGAFEEVIEDLETTREVLKSKVDEIAAAIKSELVKPK
jgi:hypothetical protein